MDLVLQLTSSLQASEQSWGASRRCCCCSFSFLACCCKRRTPAWGWGLEARVVRGLARRP